MTLEAIEKTYNRYGEKPPVEGAARRDIIKELVRNSWIRIRRYPNQFWSIQVKDIDKKTKDWIYDWSIRIQEGGIWGFRERDSFMLVRISLSGREFGVDLTVGEISMGAMYVDGESYNRRHGLVIEQSDSNE